MNKLPWVVPGLRQPRFVFYRIKLTIPTSVPPQLIFFLVFASVFYIYIGGVYNVLLNPIAIASDAQNNPVLIARGIDTQFIIEGVVAGILMFAGAFGLYLLKEASADPYNINRANSYLVGGVIVVMLSFLLLTSIMNTKTG
jgi:hypothetical protein